MDDAVRDRVELDHAAAVESQAQLRESTDRAAIARHVNADFIVARIGTCQGRMVEVVRTPHHIHLVDPATPGSWGTLAVLNSDQARELGEALVRAANH